MEKFLTFLLWVKRHVLHPCLAPLCEVACSALPLSAPGKSWLVRAWCAGENYNNPRGRREGEIKGTRDITFGKLSCCLFFLSQEGGCLFKILGNRSRETRMEFWVCAQVSKVKNACPSLDFNSLSANLQKIGFLVWRKGSR